MIPFVSVIIPVYNKAATVRRSIESVKNQDLDEIEIIVVNDGSTDNSETAILEAVAGDGRCQYIKQTNMGVAHARNNGVLHHSTGRFIVCLDSDDAIEPGYLRHLMIPMIEDGSISITYTGLRYIRPDGVTGVSNWPSTFDAKAQMQGRNQIPTAAMTRRRVWERLGGQRQRFSPVGAGAEDGEFWLRAVSYGFQPKYIPPRKDTFFVYSFLSGLVSGNKNYREPDYRAWSPWTSDPALMPTPSVVPAIKRSHPARQYDNPLVSVIIPVGPGHAKHLVNALDSLDAQTFKRWEAIVVFDISEDEWFGELRDTGMLQYIARTWPFCRFMSTYSEHKTARELHDTLDVAEGNIGLLESLPMPGQPAGAGAARNAGIARSRAPLLMFLDADDWLVPTTLRKMLDAYKEHQEIIYTDHIAVAKIDQDKLGNVDGEVVGFNERTGDAFVQQAVTDYDCSRAMEQPYTDGRPPYIICNVSALVPKKWVLKVGGFSEQIKSWEDVLMFWRLAWAGYCFTRIPEPLLVYRYYTGYRRELGRKYASSLLKYLSEVSGQTMKQKGCGCNSKGRSPTIVAAPRQGAADWSESMSRLRLSRGLMLEVGDSDLTMVEFNPPDIGDKTRYGLHDFGNGNVIVYGRFNKGDQFYVHYKDIEADRNIARGQGREPMFIITGPAREEIEVEHEVEPLKPPEEISEVEWLKPDKPVAPVLPPHDGTDVVLPDLTPKSMVSEPIFFAEAETIDQKPIDADNYFPEPTTALGRRTDIVDLELADLKSPDRYVAILKGSNIHTAWDIVKYEEKYSEKGISRLDGIGPKVRKAFVDAARKVI